MSAVPHDFAGRPARARDRPLPESSSSTESRSEQVFWQWFAVGVLIFCWITEATLCAERGF